MRSVIIEPAAHNVRIRFRDYDGIERPDYTDCVVDLREARLLAKSMSDAIAEAEKAQSLRDIERAKAVRDELARARQRADDLTAELATLEAPRHDQ